MEGKDKSNTKGAKATDNEAMQQVRHKKNEIAKKMTVKHEGRPMYFEKSTKRGETRLHAK